MVTRIIGIAGTAKNTGKTTTMTAVMERAYLENLRLGITSIGYDGEVVDNVTGLPKPRIEVKNNTYVAVAQRCLDAGTAKIEVLAETGIRTPLGKIVVGRVCEQGLLVIAGPNKSLELRAVNALLQEYGCELILVDGALNRLAPMIETQGLLLATGAARTLEIEKLAQETFALSNILNLPVCKDNGSRIIESPSLLTESMVKELLERVEDSTHIVQINGLIGENCFALLLKHGKKTLAGKLLVLPDPIKILVAGNPCRLYRIIEEMQQKNIRICVKRGVKLFAVTINPFYPKYRFVSHDYEPAYVDKEELKTALAEDSRVIVVNVVDDGVEELWQAMRPTGN